MEEANYEQVKALVEQWDYEWGCGPFEDCLPEEDELRRLNELTGRTWEAEDVLETCFEFSSHNSVDETVYFLFHGDYPPVTNVDLVFYRPKPGAALDPKTVYEKYRLGNQMKALEPLPWAEITEAIRSVPGFQEHPWAAAGYKPDHTHSLRMNGLDQPNPWSDVHFWAFWYGGRKNPEPNHVLSLSCHNLPEEQLQALIDLLAGFDLPVRYREEDHTY